MGLVGAFLGILSVLLGNAAALAQEEIPAVPASVATQVYPAGVLLGEVNSQKRVTFFWSPSSFESVAAFRKTIAPLLNPMPKSYSVLIFQMSDGIPPDTIGPGALLLCARKNTDYHALVVEFLAGAKPNAGERALGQIGSLRLNIDDNVQRVFSSRPRRELLKACPNDPLFRLRLEQWFMQSESFGREQKVARVPTVMVNGAVLLDPSPERIKAAVEMQ